MFFRKRKINSDSVQLYNVGVFTTEAVSDESFDEWVDQLMDAAENLGTAEHMMLEKHDPEQLRIMSERFPEVNLKETFFLLNVIDFDAIKEETKRMESTQKWKKFFNQIPLEEYIDAENRVVLDPSKTLLCTNDLQEAIQFLITQAEQ